MTVSVLVVDDSSFFRSRIIKLLQQFSSLKVVGEASNGKEAVEQALRLQPDVITMDYEMPVMDGISALIEIRRQKVVPVIMLSSLTFEGARLTLKALDAGAADFLVKSRLDIKGHQYPLLVEKILALGKAREAHEPPSVQRSASSVPAAARSVQPSSVRLVVVAASTGGPLAVREVLSLVPATLPCPLVIVQHMPERFTQAFAERLSEHCPMSFSEARDMEVLQPGRAYVAPGGKQLLLQQQGSHLQSRVVSEQDGRLYRPSVDVTLGSAAKVVGSATLALVLTGMGDDGTRGGKLLHAAGGRIWVQEASSCVVNGMPQSIRNAGLADEVLALGEMGRRLAQLAR